jgi:peptidoglycan DL-endopeptidase CwlO
MPSMSRRSGLALGLAALLAGVGCAKTVLTPEDYGGAPVARPPSIAPAPGPTRNATAARLATAHLGTPYRRAGASPGGFDCSGLVSYVFAKVGVAVPRRAADQYQVGTPVERDELAPGDVVFFDRLRHNGIYLGDGRFIHATQPGGVKMARLDNEWFRSRWVGARRF